MLDINGHHTPSYIDYAFWERDNNNENMLFGRHFWKTTLKDYENHLQLPYDRRPSTYTRTRCASSVTLKLTACDNQTEATLFQVYLSAYYIFLYKITQCQDIIVDTRITGRPRHEFMHTIGIFDRSLPLRFCLKPQESFASLTERIKQMSISAMVHALKFDRNRMVRNNNLLFHIPVGFQFETITNKIELTDECKLIHYARSPYSTMHDLYLSIEMNKFKQVTGSFVYACDVFDETTITVIARRFETLIDQLFFLPPSTTICEFSLMLPHEIQLLQHLNNDEDMNFSSNFLLIHQQFARQVENHPQKLAVILDDQSLTYAELFHSSQMVACHLKNECHVKSGDIVGQCVERSIEMVSLTFDCNHITVIYERSLVYYRF
jgi:non-ribosomal peptide synthetase component F